MAGRPRQPDTDPFMSRPLRQSRFDKPADDLLEQFNSSIDFDRRLAHQDIAGSRAHCRMLAACGLIPAADSRKILKGLDRIEKEIAAGRFAFSPALEDIHMHIEARLAKLIGAQAAGRLHTARSRNDQVALDLRLYLRDGIDRLDRDLRRLQTALAGKALDHAATIMPGFTHLQNGQAVTFGHHCLAYVEMLARDRERFADARRRLNRSPLGAGALAGTSFAIDPRRTARELGFAGLCPNSLDAVSDRDFVIETLAAAALCAVHLSRLGEEIILWCSVQFGFARLPDAFATGSSMMPQKRNPDAAELIRAKSGRVIAALLDMLVVMKGLPLAYAKDMQQDKQAAFQACDTLGACLQVMAAMIGGLQIDAAAMRRSAGQGMTGATDLADWLVREHALPFRAAHHIAGRACRRAETLGVELHELSPAELRKISPKLTRAARASLDVEQAVAARRAPGGTAPVNVRAAARGWLKKLDGAARRAGS